MALLLNLKLKSLPCEKQQPLKPLHSIATVLLATPVTAAAVLAAVAPPSGGPSAPVFTLAPALADTAAFLDRTTSNGATHFKGALRFF